MPTPHISALKNGIAKTVLMPGDPLRAKFIAENFLENATQFNAVRGMLGYTGQYKGRAVSVMGSGMGMPSIGIYSYELYTQYNVENIIRVGSAGAYCAKLKLFDVVLATGAYSETSFAKTQNGCTDEIILPSAQLCAALEKSAAGLGAKLSPGILHSSDVFYREKAPGTPYWQVLQQTKGCIAVEMESFALFHNANVCNKNAACLVTISDSFTLPEITTAEQREKSFTSMMEIALGAV